MPPPGLRTVVAFHVSEPSGPSRTLTPLLRALAQTGTVVTALPTLGPAAAELRPIGSVQATGHEPLVLPRGMRDALTLPWRLRRDVKRFRALLRAQRADLALVATTTLPALLLAARLERVPAVVYATELYRQGRSGDRLRTVAGAALARLDERLASATVASSERVATQLSGRAFVAYPPIDSDGEAGDAEAFRQTHGLPPGGPCLATLGNISRGRGQDTAIRAVKLLRDEFPHAQLVIGGAPHPRRPDQAFDMELRALVSDLELEDAVRFVGFVRPGDVFAVCDVFVNPARFAEPFGRAPLEALVAGRPVVSSNVGAVPDVLADGRHALLVPPDSAEALANATRRLLRDPELARRLAAEGRAHVLSSFTAERQLARFDEAIAAAIGRGRSREAHHHSRGRPRRTSTGAA